MNGFVEVISVTSFSLVLYILLAALILQYRFLAPHSMITMFLEGKKEVRLLLNFKLG
jgi:hypothetical protein